MTGKNIISTLIRKQYIRNMNVIFCKDCMYYLHNNKHPPLSKCMKYGKLNIMTSDKEYDYADITRESEDKCGMEAKNFEKKTYDNIVFFQDPFL